MMLFEAVTRTAAALGAIMTGRCPKCGGEIDRKRDVGGSGAEKIVGGSAWRR